jgi:hypothetical protein
MTLREKQSIFANLVAELIFQAQEFGYAITLGECLRSSEEAARLAKLEKGIKNSLHTKSLAIDLNLFRDGKFLDKTEDHKQLGEWWEKQSFGDIKCSWGGRFKDGNHYSIEHEGKK